MFSGSHEPFSLLCSGLSTCCSAVLFLFSCGRTVPLATSTGLSSWHLGTGWKHCCFSFIPAGAVGTQLDRCLVGNSFRWYHWTKFCDFALLHPSRCCSRWSLYSCWPLPCQRSDDRRWALELVSLPFCTGCLQLLQPQVFPFSHTQQQCLMRHNVHSQLHANRRAGHRRHS